MNLRCSYCQTPFTIGRMEKLNALQHMDAEKLNHYDTYCPRCRKASPVLRQKLEMTFPNWREALKELETEMAAHPSQEAPLPDPEPVSVSEAESKPEHHRTRAGKAVKEEEKPVAKPKAEKKPAAKTTKKSK
jgi:hypothetical protein